MTNISLIALRIDICIHWQYIKIFILVRRWHIVFKLRFNERCTVPPSPEVIEEVKRLLDQAKKDNPNLNVYEFLESLGLEPGNPPGKDKPAKLGLISVDEGTVSVQNIDVPTFRPSGEVNVLCVLCDFPDNKGKTDSKLYTDLIFSEGTFSTGSVHDYYKTVSKGKINIVGEVTGWHTLPHPYSFYVGKKNGRDGGGYPNNAKKMVEDAVSILLSNGSITWDKYDINNDGFIDAFCVVHAGRGAEVIVDEEERKKAIWSHKWQTQRMIKVTQNTHVSPYLTVPEDGDCGVWAHELGHLVFGWPDLYDACPEGDKTAGLGTWCLMASGSYGQKVGGRRGESPTYPSAWCRAVMGWSKIRVLETNEEIQAPSIQNSDEVFIIPIKNRDKEYFMLESRRKTEQDVGIPGEGLMVYHIDEATRDNCAEGHRSVGVIQADGQRNLERIGLFGNRGDDGDPYPGKSNRIFLNSEGFPNTKAYDDTKTNISLENIRWDGKTATFKVEVQ